MELRRTIIARIRAHAFPLGVDLGFADALADDILDIPQIRDALEEKRLNAMSPSQFGEMLSERLLDESEASRFDADHNG